MQMSDSKKSNCYSEDLKKQLYELNLNGKSVPTLASEYGIPAGPIYKWFSELKPIAHTEDGIPVNKKVMDGMHKRILELEMENEILKMLPPYSHENLKRESQLYYVIQTHLFDSNDVQGIKVKS